MYDNEAMCDTNVWSLFFTYTLATDLDVSCHSQSDVYNQTVLQDINVNLHPITHSVNKWTLLFQTSTTLPSTWNRFIKSMFGSKMELKEIDDSSSDSFPTYVLH